MSSTQNPLFSILAGLASAAGGQTASPAAPAKSPWVVKIEGVEVDLAPLATMILTTGKLDLQQLLPLLLPVLLVFLQKKTSKPAATPSVPTPTPKPQQPDGFIDDHIPDPVPAPAPAPAAAGRRVASVRLAIAKAQLQKDRHQDAYTDENPFGLFRDLAGLEAGTATLPWGSKFWLDATPYDQDGKEIKREDFIAMGLAFKTEIHAGDVHIIGKGAGADGQPLPGYETVSNDRIGMGISAWLATDGCQQQFKAFPASDNSDTGPLSAVIAGVKSNVLPGFHIS